MPLPPPSAVALLVLELPVVMAGTSFRDRCEGVDTQALIRRR
jgi:hypothetical protein